MLCWAMELFKVIFVVASCMIQRSLSANILYISAVASPSHFVWNRPLMYELAAQGHNVTVLSVDIEENVPENVHFIHLENVYEGLHGESDGFDFFAIGSMGPLRKLYEFEKYTVVSSQLYIKSKGFEALKNYPDDFQFDLVINDFLAGPCLLLFMHKFNYPPLIQVTAFNGASTTAPIAGSLVYPGITPNHAMDAGQDMNIYLRIQNFFASYWEVYLQDYYVLPAVDKIIRKVYPEIPYAGEFNKMTKLILLNSHPMLEFLEPMMPNIISVGGMQIKKPKELPADLKDFIDNATNGVILFSLGTNIRSDSLGDERLTNILLAMKELPQYKFLWKFESDKLPMKVPKNVLIKAWMPQNDILSHPNVKLFITHSGLLSVHETVWYGVPVVGFPVFADQFRNINYLVTIGVGRRLSIVKFEAVELVNAIKEVLGNPSYAQNMKKLSASFKDQPETALERAVWWIEWVLRNPESNFMQSPAVHLGIMEKHAFDVILVIFATVCGLVYLLGYLIFRLCSKNPRRVKTKET